MLELGQVDQITTIACSETLCIFIWWPTFAYMDFSPACFFELDTLSWRVRIWWGCCVCSVCVLSCVQPFATPWTVAGQAPLSMGLSRQEYWSELPFPPPGDLPWPRDRTFVFCISCTGRQILYHCTSWEALVRLSRKMSFRFHWRPSVSSPRLTRWGNDLRGKGFRDQM